MAEAPRQPKKKIGERFAEGFIGFCLLLPGLATLLVIAPFVAEGAMKAVFAVIGAGLAALGAILASQASGSDASPIEVDLGGPGVHFRVKR